MPSSDYQVELINYLKGVHFTLETIIKAVIPHKEDHQKIDKHVDVSMVVHVRDTYIFI